MDPRSWKSRVIATSIIILGALVIRVSLGFSSDHNSSRHFATMASAFEKAELVPDVVNAFTPAVDVEVEYAKHKVHQGNELKPSDAAHAPRVHWQTAPGVLHTLIMADPDAPSRHDPKYRNWRHWVVTNIPGSDVAKGHTVSPYVGPGPPKGTGLHRYAFLLYKQAHPLHEQVMSAKGMDGASFDVREFAKKHQLGDPVGGNYFVAQHE
eukprot:TRINITY_DN18331_c0_g1_i1.p1 TRINITY_DN18331_c0_g1~~TRINITY_DN18331_c0_g1_i1.p1  ORF type:complete len:209 (-),score=68.10 TRINITY_DN18331_c0_g1_i1:206-832(-)